jgi:hypothetical protein
MDAQFGSRATRWGEFSPVGRLLTTGHIFKSLLLAKTFSCFCHRKRYVVLILTKNVLGDILGYFFTNSSGHPVQMKVVIQKHLLWWSIEEEQAHSLLGPYKQIKL